MTQLQRPSRAHVLGLLAACTLIAVALACTSPKAAPGDSVPVGSPKKTGSQLWSENCASCHNAHSPGQYSSAQWDVAGRHMRFVANLTGEDSRKIESFLRGGK
jgi:mono/diheme cytochrome c family protein